jgi:hypothetical protein
MVAYLRFITFRSTTTLLTSGDIMGVKVEIHKSSEGFYFITTPQNVYNTDNYQEVLDILDELFKEAH